MAKASVAALAQLEPNVLAGGHGIPMTGPEPRVICTALQLV
jgi:hypothetical protein